MKPLLKSERTLKPWFLALFAIACASALGQARGGGADSWAGMKPEKDLDKEKSSIYSPVGKRDPFRPVPFNPNGRDIAALNPLEKFSIEQLQLRAILKGLGRPKAMFEDPEGKSHIVTEGDIVGRERGSVSRILNTEVIVTERTFNYLGVESLFEKVLSLPKTDQEIAAELPFETTPDVRRPETSGPQSPSSAPAAAPAPPPARAISNEAAAPQAAAPAANQPFELSNIGGDISH